MSKLPATLILVCNTGLATAQVGIGHDPSWLPDPIGPAVAVRMADMNGDGFADLVRLRGNGVELLLQNPQTGRFLRGAVQAFNATAGATLRDLAIGRLDASGDLRPDVAVLWSNGEIDVLANGGGSLARVLPRPLQALVSGAGHQILVGDVSGDGLDDVAALLDAVRPQVFLAQAGGAFVDVTATNVPAAASYARPRGVLADVDGDLDLDLVLCSTNALPPLLLGNLGAGAFQVQNGAFGLTSMPANRVLAIDLGGTALPEIVFGMAGTIVRPPIVLANNAGTFVATGAQALQLAGVLDLVAGDVDGDGWRDVVVLETTGRLGYALRRPGAVLLGQPVGVTANTEPFPLLPGHVGRTCVAAGDLEGDLDLDVAAGGDCPEALLLHGPGTTFVDTERPSFPTARRRANYAPAIVDRDGNGDLDLVGLYENGEVLALDNDGSGWFQDSSAAAALPVLANTTAWRALVPLSLAGPGRRDLVAFGDFGGPAGQIATLVNNGAAWGNQTATRFGGAITGVIAALAVYPQSHVADGLVLGTFAGQLEFHQNVGGVLVHQPTAFANGLGLFTLSSLLVDDFTGDNRPDVIALQTSGPLRLFVGTAAGFVASPLAFPVAAAGDRAAVGDLDRDGDPDLLLRTTGQPGVTALRCGAGVFTAPAGGFLGPVGFVVADAAVMQVDGEPRIVLARSDGLDVELPWNGAGFGPARVLPYRGTIVTTGLRIADVDRDGDGDLLVLRDQLDPAVMNNETVHLGQLGLCASGRAADVRLVGPQPGALAFIMLGAAQNTPTPYGLLRLSQPTIVSLFLGTASATRETVWRLAVPGGFPYARLPMQAAWFTLAGNLSFSGLEFFEIAP